MIKLLNKYFALLMFCIIFLTFFIFNNNQSKIQDFKNNSLEHVITVDRHINDDIKNKLMNLTYQDVQIIKENDKIYVKIKCPPDRYNFFSKWLFNQLKSN